MLDIFVYCTMNMNIGPNNPVNDFLVILEKVQNRVDVLIKKDLQFVKIHLVDQVVEEDSYL